jgi:hypothetical protein
MSRDQNHTDIVPVFATTIPMKPPAENVNRNAMLTPQSSDTPEEMADRIFQAFLELEDRHAEVVVRFREAFEEREKKKFLKESWQDGLAYALSELLWKLPPAFCLDLNRAGSGCSSQLAHEFEERFRRALNCVANKYPRVVLIMDENWKQNASLSLPIFLGGLLTLYAENVRVYPD